MNNSISVAEILPHDWRRLRDLRLASLQESASAFGGNYDDEKLLDESAWRAKFEKLRFLVACVNEIDAAIMSIENLVGDFGATCWVGGCWVDPQFRGLGLMRQLFFYVDQNADKNDWKIQGLGVWTDNEVAINAYLALGFLKAGEEIPSTRHPGKSYVRMIRKTQSI